jgi:hypothetical protein
LTATVTAAETAATLAALVSATLRCARFWSGWNDVFCDGRCRDRLGGFVFRSISHVIGKIRI